jgi:transcriptional regulator with XRE-family HTH domain
VALNREQALALARALRDLRESTWPDSELTQAQLAEALSSEGRVAGATLSSWESLSNPKTPSAARLNALARFFSTRRSLEGQPHLISEAELTPEETDRFRELESQLLQLLRPEDRKVQHIFQFDSGPVIVICPDAPTEVQGSLANEDDPNFTKLQRYGDLDALIQLYGHLRAENPTIDVFYRLASEVVPDDYSGHVILLGGVGWNEVTRRIQGVRSRVPIRQIEADDLVAGDIFRIKTANGERSFYPESEQLGDRNELIADVAYVARLHNPFQFNRTLTICNGIHSRGVLGAVRCLTDTSVRMTNDEYLTDRFPDGEFAVLLRVPVVGNEPLSPDLRDPARRLYEWEPKQGGVLTEAGFAASRPVVKEAQPARV